MSLRMTRRVNPAPLRHERHLTIHRQRLHTRAKINGLLRIGEGKEGHRALAHRWIRLRVIGLAREMRQLQRVRVDRHGPMLEKVGERTNMIEMAMSHQDRGRWPFGAE